MHHRTMASLCAESESSCRRGNARNLCSKRYGQDKKRLASRPLWQLTVLLLASLLSLVKGVGGMDDLHVNASGHGAEGRPPLDRSLETGGISVAQAHIEADIALGRRRVNFSRTSSRANTDGAPEHLLIAEENEDDADSKFSDHDGASAHVSCHTRNTGGVRHPFCCDDALWPLLLRGASTLDTSLGDANAVQTDRRTLQNSADTASRTKVTSGVSTLLTPKPGFRPIRLMFDVSHLFDDESICLFPGQKRTDFLFSENVTCGTTDVLTPAKRTFVVDQILPEVHERITRLFSVPGVQAFNRKKSATSRRSRSDDGLSSLPLSAERPRASDHRSDREDETRMHVPQGICGPLLQIPRDHTEEGLAGVDMLVYVLAGPAPLSFRPDTSSVKARDNTVRRHRNVSSLAGEGGGGSMAWSGYCGVDHTGRPAVGRVNLVPRYIPTSRPRTDMARVVAETSTMDGAGAPNDDPALDTVFLADAMLDDTALAGDPSSWATERYVRAVMHEVFHVLGFAPPFFDKLAREGPRKGESNSHKQKREEASSVSSCRNAVVVDAARSFFGCEDITAVPLENSGGTGTAGAHWERRWLRDDIMAGTPSRVSAVTSVTGAFFHALPFYSFNAAYVEDQRVRWGRGLGCEVTSPTCEPLGVSRAWGLHPPSEATSFNESVGGSTTRTPAPRRAKKHRGRSPAGRLTAEEVARARMWCLDLDGLFAYLASRGGLWTPEGNVVVRKRASLELPQCTSDRRAIAMCNARLRSSASARDVSPPMPPVADAPAVTSVGEGQSPFMDACPVVEAAGTTSGFSPLSSVSHATGALAEDATTTGVQCTASPHPDWGLAAAGALGVVHGAQSRCVHVITTTTDRREAYDGERGNSFPRNARITSVEATCVPVRCPLGARVEIQRDGQWLTCPLDGSAGLILADGNEKRAAHTTGGVGASPVAVVTSWLVCEDAAVLCEDSLYYQLPAPRQELRKAKDRSVLPSPAELAQRRTPRSLPSGINVTSPREVAITVELSIQPALPPHGVRIKSTHGKENATSDEEPFPLTGDIDWPIMLSLCPGAVGSAVRKDVGRLLRPVQQTKASRDGVKQDEIAVEDVTGFRFLPLFTATVIALPLPSSINQPQTGESGASLWPSTTAVSTERPVLHGTRRRRLAAAALTPQLIDSTVDPNTPQRSSVGVHDGRQFVVTFQMAATVPPGLSPATVVPFLREHWSRLLAPKSTLPALTHLARRTATANPSFCGLYGESGLGQAGGGVCPADWMTGTPARDFSEHVDTPTLCNKFAERGFFTLTGVKLLSSGGPAVSVDEPSPVNVVAAADVSIALVLETAPTRAASGPLSDELAIDADARLPPLRGLSPDISRLVARAVQLDMASVLAVTPNLLLPVSLSTARSLPGELDIAEDGVILLDMTIYASPSLSSDVTRSTRALWRASLEAAAGRPLNSSTWSHTAAAMCRLHQGQGRLGVESGSQACLLARLLSFRLTKAHPGTDNSQSLWAELTDRKDTSGQTDVKDLRGHSSNSWTLSSGTHLYCIPVPAQFREGGRLCVQLTNFILILGLSTLALISVTVTLAHGRRTEVSESDWESDKDVDFLRA